MHIKAPLRHSPIGTLWSQCAKCNLCFGLSQNFTEGSHLCCRDCGQNLLLAKMSEVEWEALCAQFPQPLSPVMTTIRPSKMPMWGNCRGAVEGTRSMAKKLQERGFLVRNNVGSKPRVADITGFAAGRRYEFDIASGASKVLEQAMDASQRNEKLKQELIRQYTNAAAYKLGKVAKTYLTHDERNAAKKGIKDYLAKCLVLIGCSYSETGEIIQELVEGLKNV